MRLYCTALAVAVTACATAPRPRPPAKADADLIRRADGLAAARPRALILPPEDDLPEADERDAAIGVMLVEQGKHQQAAVIFSRLRKRNPAHAGVLEDLIWACLPAASCKRQLGGLQRALSEHVDRYPGDVARRLTLIDLLEANGAHDAQRQHIDMLIRDFPDLGEGWLFAGEIALAVSHPSAAQTFIDRASARRFYDQHNRTRLRALRADLRAYLRDVKSASLARARERQLHQQELADQAFLLRMDESVDF